jgi:hypothetical protein
MRSGTAKAARRALLPALLALWLPAGALRAEPETSGWKSKVHFSGDLKSYFLAKQPVEIEGDSLTQDQPLQGLNQTKLRLRLAFAPSAKIAFELAYEVLPTVQENLTAIAPNPAFSPAAPAFRVDDLSANLYPKPGERGGSFVLGQNLDRALLTLSGRLGSLSLGRQPIAFGVARVISPTDIIAPYAFNALDTEYRIGVDAARVQLPLRARGQLDLGTIFGDGFRWRRSAAFGRVTFPVKTNQLGLTAIDFKDNLLAGLSLTRSLGGAGVWAEGAYTWAKLFDQPRPKQDYFRASAGLDYNFNVKSGLYVFLEYHYNGASSGDPAQYLEQTGKVAYQEGGVYLLGRHYLAPGATFQVTPLLTFTLASLVNLADGSGYVLPHLEYNFSENVYLALGADVAVGRQARLELPEGVVPQSEFGLYPTFYFTSIRLYF